jgi:alkanesulfonate monooxygenase SsuD/methylene tetrahydromethanopterin reductase-like flavin-dependent oxidoreductase (luciferase family)
MLAKIADTVDDISGGRVVLGLGAGWVEAEFHAFGFPFDHRVGRFEEAIQIITGLLHREPASFEGTYHAVRDGELLPPGPRPQGPPIMVAAKGPRMLRLTARYADAWNADFGSTPTTIQTLNNEVDAACRDVGRDSGTLGRSASLLVNVPGHGQPGDNWVADSRADHAAPFSKVPAGRIALRCAASGLIDTVNGARWLENGQNGCR